MKKTVMIVDDSRVERHLMEQYLIEGGYSFFCADSGEQAVILAQEKLPDLILMDVVMPGIGGFSATRQIARDKKTQHIPVIMCTSRGGKHDKYWGLKQGANEYLVKPVMKEELLAKLKEILG